MIQFGKAGLFSAVITAFIVESYQKLQPGPSDQIVLLLSRISDQLAHSPNGTATPLIPNVNTPFTPSRSDVRVNIFWFISLVFSLTAALIGIITLQWLREHQRYSSSSKPNTAFSAFNARSEGLRRWYVPQIFAVLPLLLQGALILFFCWARRLLVHHPDRGRHPCCRGARYPHSFLGSHHLASNAAALRDGVPASLVSELRCSRTLSVQITTVPHLPKNSNSLAAFLPPLRLHFCRNVCAICWYHTLVCDLQETLLWEVGAFPWRG